MLTGRHDCDYVEIDGVVQRAWRSPDPNMHTLFADVAVEDGVLRATFWDYTPDGLRALHRRARPAARQRRHALRATAQLRGVSLFVGRTSDIVRARVRRPIRSRCPSARSAASTTTPPAAR